MHIKKGSKLYARIDYRLDGKEITPQDLQDHLAYVKSIAGERPFTGGGFSNTDGGMCLFQAENLEDAHKFAQNDPIIQRGFYRYEIFVWNVAVVSEDATDL